MTPISNLNELPPAPRVTAIGIWGWWRMVAPGILFVLVVCLMFDWVASRHSRFESLAGGGEYVNAPVTGKYIQGSKSTSYYLTAGYSVDGRQYTGTDEVDRDQYRAAAVGRTTVPLTYSRADPSQYEIGVVDGGRVSADLRDTTLIAVAAIASAAAILGYAIFTVVRALAFGRVCEMAQGVVTGLYSSRINTGNSATTYYYAKYSFEVNGEEFTRQTSVNRRYQATHADGDAIPVLYDPSDPNRSRIQREMRMVCTVPALARPAPRAAVDSGGDDMWFKPPTR